MKTETKGSTETWLVRFDGHNFGAAGNSFVRKTEKLAERSAKLMRKCGYREVTVSQWTK